MHQEKVATNEFALGEIFEPTKLILVDTRTTYLYVHTLLRVLCVPLVYRTR